MKKLPTVEDIMDKHFIKLEADTGICEAIDLFLRKDLFGACIVDDRGDLLGILPEKSCLGLCNKVLVGDRPCPEPGETVNDYIYKEVQTVPPTMGIVEAAQLFLSNEYRRMPVVVSGKLVGQITRRDIVRAIRKFRLG